MRSQDPMGSQVCGSSVHWHCGLSQNEVCEANMKVHAWSVWEGDKRPATVYGLCRVSWAAALWPWAKTWNTFWSLLLVVWEFTVSHSGLKPWFWSLFSAFWLQTSRHTLATPGIPSRPTKWPPKWADKGFWPNTTQNWNTLAWDFKKRQCLLSG